MLSSKEPDSKLTDTKFHWSRVNNGKLNSCYGIVISLQICRICNIPLIALQPLCFLPCTEDKLLIKCNIVSTGGVNFLQSKFRM